MYIYIYIYIHISIYTYKFLFLILHVSQCSVGFLGGTLSADLGLVRGVDLGVNLRDLVLHEIVAQENNNVP